MAINKTFSVRHGLDVANTIVLDSDRNLSNITNANIHTVNANTYVTVAGLNVVDHINAAFSTANSKVESINVSGNGLSVSNSTTSNLNQYTLSVNSATTIERGTTLLIDSISSSDIANAATANAVKTAWDYANTKLSLNGGTIGGDLNIAGNLTITGNTTYQNVETYIVDDPLIYLAANNDTSDLVDIGFMGGHNTAGVYQHSGLIRHAVDGDWYLFTGLAEEGHENNVVDVANTTYATLRANINAQSILIVGNSVATQANLTLAHDQANTARNTANDAYAQANAAYAQANLAYDAANNAKVTVFANNASNVTTQNLNFVNTSTVTVVVTPDGANANVEFIAAPQTIVLDSYFDSGNVTAAATANIANGLYAIATSAYEKANAPLTVKEIYSTNNTVVNSFANISTIQFDTESGMAVVDESNNTVTIQLNSTFKFWEVDGNTGLEAFGLDTVNFISGNGISIVANNNASPKSITFETTGLLSNVAVSANSGSTVNANGLNFVNSATVTVSVNNSGDGNANISFESTAGGEGVIFTDVFTGNGACTQFGVSQNSDPEHTFVFLNGVSQKPYIDYSVNNQILTMNTAPANNSKLEVRTLERVSTVELRQSRVLSDTFSGTGACTQFSLSQATVTNKALVYIDGVAQVPGTDYTIIGSRLQFSTAPLNGTVIEARTFSEFLAGNASSVSSTAAVGDGNTTVYTLSSNSTTNATFVFVDGVVQVPAVDYTVANNLITFTNPPEANGVIEMRSIYDLNLIDYSTSITNTNSTFGVTTTSLEYTNGEFNTLGDSVSRTYLLRGTTTGNTETEIFLTGNLRIPVKANSTVFYTADIVAKRTDDNLTIESAGFYIKGVADNVNGTTDDVGDLYEVVVAEDDLNLSVDARANNSTDSINIYVTGIAGKTFRWTALVRTVEVSD